MTLPQRILTRVDVRDGHLATPCWLWRGSVTADGYGQIRAPALGYATPQHIHRVMWVDLHGPVPDGLELDHLCEIPRCCNPDHLEAVTHRENLQRAYRSRAR